jgi:replicative DNA helicase
MNVKKYEYNLLNLVMKMDLEELRKKINLIDFKILKHTDNLFWIIDMNLEARRRTDWEELAEFAGISREEMIAKAKQYVDSSEEKMIFSYVLEKLKENYQRQEFETISKRLQEELGKIKIESKVDLNNLERKISTYGSSLLENEADFTFSGMQEDMILECQNSEGKAYSISTGYSELDSKLNSGGFATKNVHLIAARSNMGKSTFVYNLYRNACLAGNTAYLVSLEGSVETEIYPVLSSIACQLADDLPNMRRNDFARSVINERVNGENSLQWIDKYSEVANFLDDYGINRGIRDKTKELGFTADPEKLYELVLGLPEETEIIFIDHLHEYNTAAKFNQNGGKLVGKILQKLSKLAKKKDIAIVALAQLNRNSENPNNYQKQRSYVRRPVISDLRASGTIEEVSDTVIMLYNEAYQMTEEEKKENLITGNELEVLIRKQRNGGKGRVLLHFEGSTGYIRERKELDEFEGIVDFSLDENDTENNDSEELKLELSLAQ